jgi:hypothetical protein
MTIEIKQPAHQLLTDPSPDLCEVIRQLVGKRGPHGKLMDAADAQDYIFHAIFEADGFHAIAWAECNESSPICAYVMNQCRDPRSLRFSSYFG